MAASARKGNGGPRRWAIAQADEASVRRLELEQGISPLLARTLVGRGLTAPQEARLFLDARLADNLGDPFGLKDMERAADRVADAVRRKERIAVFGDYDVDGITATVLLLRLLRWLGADPFYYIPHRVDEGYGLSCEAIDLLADKGTRLLITVDNGISSVAEVDYAMSRGLDCVITDHHLAGPQLPRAWAVVNPNRSDCTYGFVHFSGVGVAFKLAHAVLRRLGIEESEAKAFLLSQLDIVALGTVADIVPLIGENRALARAGLARLERTDNAGLAALLRLCERNVKPLSAETITYFLAPRLNAAGRTEHASLAAELLLTTDPARAEDLAHQLEELNDRRRAVERHIFDDGMALIPQQCDMERDLVYVVLGHQWHLGVIGIVASKLSDHFGRPVVVLSETDGLARGSARSIPGFDIHSALTECADILETFGGHPQAAGLSLSAERVGQLRERLNAIAVESLGDEEAVEKLTIDAVCDAEDLGLDAVEDLQALEPCGFGNPRPIFALLGADMIREPRVVGANHLKLTIASGHTDFDVIGFGMAGALNELRDISGPIDIAFRPAISNWTGSPRVELQLCDFRPSET
jgi:single-stranded-DNA-specific exonuclease